MAKAEKKDKGTTWIRVDISNTGGKSQPIKLGSKQLTGRMVNGSTGFETPSQGVVMMVETYDMSKAKEGVFVPATYSGMCARGLTSQYVISASFEINEMMEPIKCENNQLNVWAVAGKARVLYIEVK